MFLLKCTVGLFATVGFLFIAAIVLAAVFAPRLDRLEAARRAVPDQAVLLLDLSDGIIEQRPDNALARASVGGALVLRDAVTALHAAGRDDRVKGLVVRAGWGSPGLAQMQELRDAVADFRAQGKPVTEEDVLDLIHFDLGLRQGQLVERRPGKAMYFWEYRCRRPEDVKILMAVLRVTSGGYRPDLRKALPYFGNFPIRKLPEGVAGAHPDRSPQRRSQGHARHDDDSCQDRQR